MESVTAECDSYSISSANTANQDKESILEDFETWSAVAFFETLRLKRATANYLIEMFEKSIIFRSLSCDGKRMPAKMQIYLFLWYAGNECSFQEVATMFNISIFEAYHHLDVILGFMLTIASAYIKFPDTESEKIDISKSFEEIAGLKNVIGCIDLSWIPTKTQNFKNNYNMLSLPLQCICDANMKFLDIFVGSIHDRHKSQEYNIFPLSVIAKDLPSICGKKFHLLGDNKYPLREHIITPVTACGNSYTDFHLTFNNRHNQTRITVEDAIALLKRRFRQLICMERLTPMRMFQFITACCVMHNMCIDLGDHFEMQPTKSEVELRSLGEKKRTLIFTTL